MLLVHAHLQLPFFLYGVSVRGKSSQRPSRLGGGRSAIRPHSVFQNTVARAWFNASCRSRRLTCPLHRFLQQLAREQRKDWLRSIRTEMAKAATCPPVQDWFEARFNLFLQYFNPCRLAPPLQVHMHRTKCFTEYEQSRPELAIGE